jgi:hypothetical protein
VTSETWRPLGVDTDERVAAYDALHEEVPPWMWAPFWTWVRGALTVIRTYSDGSGRVPMLNVSLAEEMCQSLRIPLPELRSPVGTSAGERQLSVALAKLVAHGQPLQIADYLLAHGERVRADDLSALLERSKSAWRVGSRAGRPGLVRRVPEGVQVAADAVMRRAGKAGVRLAEAWEALYGVAPDASKAYAASIKAVEDAAIPAVSPTNHNATLGTVLRQIEDQGNWELPMTREHERAPSRDVLIAMIRLLWHGQHDRHGGQPSAPGDVSVSEATVAVSIAVTLVNWFEAGTIGRRVSQG